MLCNVRAGAVMYHLYTLGFRMQVSYIGQTAFYTISFTCIVLCEVCVLKLSSCKSTFCCITSLICIINKLRILITASANNSSKAHRKLYVFSPPGKTCV